MRLALVDIETSGWNRVYARVIEIGIVVVEDGQIIDTYETLIQPVRPVGRLPAGITALTGITEADLVGKPSFGEIADEIAARLEGALFIAHNVSFDYSFLYYEFLRLKREFHYPRACTVRVSRSIFPETPRHRLEDIIRHHSISTERRHRALDDALVLHEFLKKCEAKVGPDGLAATLRGCTSDYVMSGI